IKKYRLLEENDYQIDFEELKGLITEKTKMIVIVSPSNPTGGVLDKKSLESIAEIAKKHDLLVLSDEIYERLTYDEEKPAISIASLEGMKERTIVLNGLSKSMAMTGWRLGYIAAPVELIEPMNRMAFYMTAGATTFVTHAATEAIKDLDGSIRKMRDEFKKRRDYLVEEVNKLKNFSCKMPEGAFYVFMNIKKTGMTSEEFCEYALDRVRLAVVPGDAFGEAGEGYVRMSYATSMENLNKAMQLLRILDEELTEK
ncbi:MAG: aminotransferase class I/II-fold pyridoxal phosphate-dependent enzyme, partial [Firmicutes bacterium]|nr:aminotransferase class I/II-fold pyridoxal phosphate-dependent enzyme [Bacillota bacterium]